jgi:hypothetical protein
MYIKFIKTYLTYSVGQVLFTEEATADKLLDLGLVEESDKKVFRDYNKTVTSEIAKSLVKAKPVVEAVPCEDCEGAKAKIKAEMALFEKEKAEAIKDQELFEAEKVAFELAKKKK